MHLSLIAQTCWGRLLMQGIMLEWVQAREREEQVLPLHMVSGNMYKLLFVLSKRKTVSQPSCHWEGSVCLVLAGL